MPGTLRRTPRHGGSLARVAAALTLLSLTMWIGSAHAQKGGSADGQKPQPAPQVAAATQKAAIKEFDERLKSYLALRSELTKKLDPLKTTEDAGELVERQTALATAIRAARQHAKRGDLISAEVGSQIRETVAADLKAREPKAKSATLDEVPAVKLQLNSTYPAAAALTTIPPLLLARLPVLPDNLQYRFVGRHMALLDGDVHIVLDYVENVLPPK